MKRIGVLFFCVCAMVAKAQPDGDVIYYEDSKVKKSRISLALNLNPNWTDRRLIDEDVPTEYGYVLPNDNADGAFELNYGLDVFFRLGSALRIGAGFGIANADFDVQRALYFHDRPDTVMVNTSTEVSMYTLPIKLNFYTSLNDAFDLEVIPQVQLNFVNKYQNNYRPVNGQASFSEDLTDETKDLSYAVGIALGGTFKLSDNWGLFVRGDIKYMVTPLIENNGYPREALYNFGLNMGLKYSF